MFSHFDETWVYLQGSKVSLDSFVIYATVLGIPLFVAAQDNFIILSLSNLVQFDFNTFI